MGHRCSSAQRAASSAAARSSATIPTRVRRSRRSSASTRPLVGDAPEQLGAGHGHPAPRPVRRARRRRSPVRATASARTAGASVPKRRTSRAGASTAARRERAAAPTSGRSRVRHGGTRHAAGQPAAGDHRVDGVLGHPPVGRELAAHDGHHPGVGGQHGVLAGQVGGVVGRALGGQQRAQPGVGADHVGPGERRLEGRAHRVEQEVDLGLGRDGDVGHLAVGRLVGQPDVHQAVGLGQGEHEPVQRARHGGGDGDVDARPGARRAAPGGCRGWDAG